jgi:hypothetical protein
MEEGTFTEEQLLFGIRRSVKGQAFNILRNMGPGAVRLKEILTKFEATYGQIDTPESILKQFYACRQEDSESLITYAARIEEIYAQAAELGAIGPHSKTTLKNVFYQGLKQPLKQMCVYQYYTFDDYDKLKVECRKVESELPTVPNADVKTKCHAANPKPESSEYKELKDLITQLNARIHKLELEKSQPTPPQGDQPFRGNYRGRRHHRGARNRGGANGRGRGSYEPNRPTASTTFKPAESSNEGYQPIICYRCQKEGHIARNCTENL